MNSLLLNTATTSAVFEGGTLMYLCQRFGNKLSVNNKELAMYLEEAVHNVFVDAKLIELTKLEINNYSLTASFKLIFDGVSSPEEVINEYMLSFNTLNECINFAKNINLNIKSSLLKYNNKYYFYILSPLTINMEEKIIENFAEIIFDPLIISRILEHAEVIIESRAIKNLKDF